MVFYFMDCPLLNEGGMEHSLLTTASAVAELKLKGAKRFGVGAPKSKTLEFQFRAGYPTSPIG